MEMMSETLMAGVAAIVLAEIVAGVTVAAGTEPVLDCFVHPLSSVHLVRSPDADR